uniref:Uncharacterized protein n=1 Tax=Manihot esculenta TaxID=3983 RepID=A0A251L1X4_MANES
MRLSMIMGDQRDGYTMCVFSCFREREIFLFSIGFPYMDQARRCSGHLKKKRLFISKILYYALYILANN